MQDPIQRAAEIHLSAVVVGELLAGFKRGDRTKQNEERLRRFVTTTRVRLLAVDEETAERYAAMKDYLRREGTPIPANDLWIAASAWQHGLRVLTSDEHFLRIPQIMVDFFEPIPPSA